MRVRELELARQKPPSASEQLCLCLPSPPASWPGETSLSRLLELEKPRTFPSSNQFHTIMQKAKQRSLSRKGFPVGTQPVLFSSACVYRSHSVILCKGLQCKGTGEASPGVWFQEPLLTSLAPPGSKDHPAPVPPVSEQGPEQRRCVAVS